MENGNAEGNGKRKGENEREREMREADAITSRLCAVVIPAISSISR